MISRWDDALDVGLIRAIFRGSSHRRCLSASHLSQALGSRMNIPTTSSSSSDDASLLLDLSDTLPAASFRQRGAGRVSPSRTWWHLRTERPQFSRR
jgi:hypothetical protein